MHNNAHTPVLLSGHGVSVGGFMADLGWKIGEVGCKKGTWVEGDAVALSSQLQPI